MKKILVVEDEQNLREGIVTAFEDRGWSVTSAVNSGTAQISSSVCFCRTARYSGRKRPACLMNHAGVWSTG